MEEPGAEGDEAPTAGAVVATMLGLTGRAMGVPSGYGGHQRGGGKGGVGRRGGRRGAIFLSTANFPSSLELDLLLDCC